MVAQPQQTLPFWTRESFAAVLLGTVALATALGSWLYTRHSARMIEATQVQQLVTETLLTRAMHCVDMASAGLDDPDRAEMSLAMSNGMTLCLVQARDEAQIDIDRLGDCVRTLETANLVLDPTGATARPAC